MIRKLLCWLGFHKWGNWEDKSYDEGYYDQAFWQERKCLYCNLTQVEYKD